MVNPQEFMRFAFSSLLHLLREQALQVASDMVGGGDAHEDGEVLLSGRFPVAVLLNRQSYKK